METLLLLMLIEMMAASWLEGRCTREEKKQQRYHVTIPVTESKIRLVADCTNIVDCCNVINYVRVPTNNHHNHNLEPGWNIMTYYIMTSTIIY